MDKNISFKTLYGVCIGMLVLLPACGRYQPWHPNESTFAGNSYSSKKDGVRVRVKALSADETSQLFGGQGKALLGERRKGKRKKSSSRKARMLVVQVRNKSDKAIQLSRDLLSVPTLSAQEVYDVVSVDPVARGIASGVAGGVAGGVAVPFLLLASLLGLSAIIG